MWLSRTPNYFFVDIPTVCSSQLHSEAFFWFLLPQYLALLIIGTHSPQIYPFSQDDTPHSLLHEVGSLAFRRHPEALAKRCELSNK